ncbi:MAG TPA: zinc metallopeptidase [Clostridiaceae bacterium]|jgi:Zn-dependent membrane protease YugP|nr:zinc metallopeptidase [Clostridiaceae bacterium]
MPYYFMDSTYFLFILPALILGMVAQFMVKNRFQKYSKIRAGSGYTGEAAATRILRENQLHDVRVEQTPGSLTDHYSPKEKVLRLSDATFASPSIAAIGVAAHEAGHAVQDATGYLPNKIRAALVPVAQIGSSAGPYLAIFGLFIQSTTGDLLFNIGIILYFFALLFYLVTLPVEFDASRRAIASLDQSGMLSSEELKGAKKVLNAAALTYVASALTAVLSLLRLILLSRNRRR